MSTAPVLPHCPSFHEVVSRSELASVTELPFAGGRRARALFSPGQERPAEVYSASWPVLSSSEMTELRNLVSEVGFSFPVLAAPDGSEALKPYRIASFEERLETGNTYSARMTLERLHGLPVLTPEEE